jgi:hypothetical protein
MNEEMNELKVFVVGRPGHWVVTLEVNGKEWKRFGPWPDRATADMYCSEALARARKLAERYKQ